MGASKRVPTPLHLILCACVLVRVHVLVRMCTCVCRRVWRVDGSPYGLHGGRGRNAAVATRIGLPIPLTIFRALKVFISTFAAAHPIGTLSKIANRHKVLDREEREHEKERVHAYARKRCVCIYIHRYAQLECGQWAPS